MRCSVLILAVIVSACASHKPPAPVDQSEPTTEGRCASAIQDAVDRMSAVDFNTDRKGEVRRYIAKARDAQAKGDFGKCIKFADKAVEAT